MNNLVISENAMIEYKVGEIRFDGYKILKERATKFANNLKETVVTEESIKESKKVLAEVNKDIKKLDDKRLFIKKQLLEPYNNFEIKVKEIVNIVKEADNIVRSQVRELEEKERENKRNILKELFDNKLKHYDFKELILFDNFFEQRMANKTTSVDKVEEEMSNWLEQRKMDMSVIENLDYDKTLLIKEYIKSFNLSQAIQTLKNNREREEKIKQVVSKNNEIEKIYIITIKNEKDAKLAQMLLNENKIEYNMEVK